MKTFLLGGCILLVLWISCVWGIYRSLSYDQENYQKEDVNHLKDLAMKKGLMSGYEQYSLQGRRNFYGWVDKGFNNICSGIKKAGAGVKKKIGGSWSVTKNVVVKKSINEVKDTTQKIIDRFKEIAKKVLDNFIQTEKATTEMPITDVLKNVNDTTNIIRNIVNTVKCLNIVDRLNTTLRFDININNDDSIFDLNEDIYQIVEIEEIVHDEVDYIIDNAIYIREQLNKVIKLQGRFRFG